MNPLSYRHLAIAKSRWSRFAPSLLVLLIMCMAYPKFINNFGTIRVDEIHSAPKAMSSNSREPKTVPQVTEVDMGGDKWQADPHPEAYSNQNATPIAFRDKKEDGYNLVFIIGNGRTGTNWLGQILLSHPNVTGANERQPEFGLVTALAVRISLLDEAEFRTRFEKVVQQYRRRSQETAAMKRAYHSDKSHPALFFSPELQEALPGAHFVGIHRCVYPTVASCMLHKGVSKWFEVEELLYKPNKFLGTTERHLGRYNSIPYHVRCALRWASHQLEYERVGPILNSSPNQRNNILLLDYRTMLLDTERQLKKLQSFLGLTMTFDHAPVGHPFDPVSWKKKLTEKMRHDIDEELEHMGLSHLLTTYCHETERAP